jgi:hypothetical protein
LSATIRIPIIFISPETSPNSYTGALGGPPLIREWLEKEMHKLIYVLRNNFSDTDLVFYVVKNVDDAVKVLDSEKDSIGFVVVLLHTWSGGATRVFLESGKPVILIAESYGGGGEFLLEYGRAVKENRPVIGISIRDLDDEIVIKKIRLLKVLARLKMTRILFVTLNIDWFRKISSLIHDLFGIEPVVIDGREFVEKYYMKTDDAEAEKYMREWIKNADRVYETSHIDILKAAKLYIAMRKALEDHKADSIAVDCINLYDSKVLDAWPCLGYMQLWLDGYVPVCEADPYSAVMLLIIWLLNNEPGFISDPVLDYKNNEIIYYHCYAPINPLGGNIRVSYSITSAHLGLKKASVHVDLPVNQIITAAQIIPDQKTIIIHKAKTLRNEFSSHACATKLVATSNVKALARNWRWTWHRVVFYGDFAEDIKDLARLIGFKVIEEDKLRED